MNEVLPGILEKDFSEIEKKLLVVKPFARVIHIDIIDGKFASNNTFLDPAPFAKFSEEFFFEVHMMVDEPVNYLDKFAKSGFKRFIGHVERMSDQVAFVVKAQKLGEVALGIDLPTPVSVIEVPLIDLDSVLLMSVKAGFSGQKFDISALEKVKELRSRDALLNIEMDGGINESNIAECVSSGASRFVATSYLFSSESFYLLYLLLSKIRLRIMLKLSLYIR